MNIFHKSLISLIEVTSAKRPVL